MRYKTEIDEKNGYIFKQYYGNFQKIKYDVKKDDYYVTFHGDKYYFNNCLRTGAPDQWNGLDIVGSWQEGYSVYLLVADGDISESERAKVVYCPPASYYRAGA